LIRLGNLEVISSERNRLAGYPIMGHAEYIYEDMRDEFVAVMDSIYSALDNRQQDPTDILVQKFNDPDVANHILYYLRLLASSWLKTDPEAGGYAAFIPEDIGITSYCDNNIDLPGREIEHLGIMVLYNLLLKPTGMVLEIAYLDRSPGPEVTTYRFPGEADGQDVSTLGPLMCLLFRPDHYDILYRHPIPAPVAPLDIQVHRAGSFSHDQQNAPHTPSLQDFSSGVDMTALSMIPGLGFGSGPPTGIPVLGISSTPWMSSPIPENLPIRQPQQYQRQQEQEEPVIAAQPASVLPPPLHRQTPPLRFSGYCYPQLMDSNETWREPAFSTNTFKNSHFNTAHYNNPNFEPEQYRPDLEESYYEATRPGRQRRSH
jgi:ubiquitin thioesterase protein OTUB1